MFKLLSYPLFFCLFIFFNKKKTYNSKTQIFVMCLFVYSVTDIEKLKMFSNTTDCSAEVSRTSQFNFGYKSN